MEHFLLGASVGNGLQVGQILSTRFTLAVKPEQILVTRAKIHN